MDRDVRELIEKASRYTIQREPSGWGMIGSSGSAFHVTYDPKAELDAAIARVEARLIPEDALRRMRNEWDNWYEYRAEDGLLEALLEALAGGPADGEERNDG